MFGSFQTSNHQRPTSAAPKRVTTASRKPRTSAWKRANSAGGSIGEGETAAGKKASGRKGVRPRETSASSAARVGEKSIGAAGEGQMVPLLTGKVASRSPAFSAPKTRTAPK